jgi:hypothetical protein
MQKLRNDVFKHCSPCKTLAAASTGVADTYTWLPAAAAAAGAVVFLDAAAANAAVAALEFLLPCLLLPSLTKHFVQCC